jgi:hypothetical protein
VGAALRVVDEVLADHAQLAAEHPGRASAAE